MADKRPSRHPRDFNEVAFSVVQIATGQAPKPEPPKPKNQAAVTLGRMGGLMGGGKKRMAALTKEQRSELAKKAAAKRWAKP